MRKVDAERWRLLRVLEHELAGRVAAVPTAFARQRAGTASVAQL